MYKITVKIRGLEDIKKIKDFIRDNNIKLVLFGEYHGFIGQSKLQKEILKDVKPDFFLYELLEEKKILNNKEAKIFLETPNNKNFSVVSTYGQLKPIIKLARCFSLPIIGCDLKNIGVTDGWRKKIISNEDARRVTNKRELQQSKIINRYASKGLVFALLGEYHLRRSSLLLSKLKSKKIIVVKPLFRWKKRFNHLKKFNKSEVSYLIKLIKK